MKFCSTSWTGRRVEHPRSRVGLRWPVAITTSGSPHEDIGWEIRRQGGRRAQAAEGNAAEQRLTELYTRAVDQLGAAECSGAGPGRCRPGDMTCKGDQRSPPGGPVANGRLSGPRRSDRGHTENEPSAQAPDGDSTRFGVDLDAT